MYDIELLLVRFGKKLIFVFSHLIDAIVFRMYCLPMNNNFKTGKFACLDYVMALRRISTN